MCHERWALHVVIKRNFFYIYICSFSTIFYAISFSDTCLMNRKSISKPNFDKISQSMAEMNYFRFRKTDDRHIGFPFQFIFWRMCSHRRVILHLFSKFRTDRRIGGGVMASYWFFKMAAYCRKCTSGFRFSDGIWLRMWKSMCLPNFDERLR